MTQANRNTGSSEIRFSQLLSQVVLLLLGTPPLLRVVQVVVGSSDAADSRISMGGYHYGCA